MQQEFRKMVKLLSILWIWVFCFSQAGWAHRLSVTDVRGSTIRLSPKIHKKALPNALPTIHLTELKPFLNDSEVLENDYLATAPYVIAYSGEHIIGGPGEYVYVKGLVHPQGKHFRIYRDGGPYLDPKTHEVLGFDAIYVADAKLAQKGNPAALMITKSSMEINTGDRILPAPPNVLRPYYNPRPPKHPVHGQILRLLGNINQAGGHQVAVISRGHADGVRAGDILNIYEEKELAEDPLMPGQYERLPSEQEGSLMVYRVFSHVSFGLILHATGVIRTKDIVTYP